RSYDNTPIGQPIYNNRIYILKPGTLQLQPVGIAGELCIGGDSLARGYLNQPELTDRKFVYYNLEITNEIHSRDTPSRQNHKIIQPTNPQRIYLTGDLARRLPDGNIEFLGRIDHQVKIRGFRIELGEIESRLLKQGNIREAVIIDWEDGTGGKYLCAYVVYSDPSVLPDLRKYLSKNLPDYMIPLYFVRLEKIPLTALGKVDRNVLPAPELKAGSDHIAPGGTSEIALAQLWSEVLGVEESIIGINSNFFELGGHSLRATIMVSRIHKILNVKVPLTEVFRTPTIRGLSQYIHSAAQERYATIEPVEKREYYGLSSTQKRLYIIQQMDLGNIAYNMPQFIPFEKMTSLEKLEEAFIKLINRHESLRTSFHMLDTQPVQKVHDHAEFSIEHREDSLEHSDLQSFVRPFDLSRAPLLRVELATTGKGRDILMVDMHHIISDGISMDVLRTDFLELYEGKTLPPLRIQYKDFTRWQNSEQQTERISNQTTYWLNQFEGEIPVLQLPVDYPRPVVQSFEGSSFDFQLSAEDIYGLRAIALETGATLFMVLLLLTNILMFKLSGQEDIVIGTPIAGRRHADLEKIIGMFVNTLNMRNYPRSHMTIKGFLQEVKERTLKAFENQECQFDDLVEQLPVERDTGRNPLFDVLFTLNNLNTAPASGNTAAAVEAKESQPGSPVNEGAGRVAKFDLTIVAVETGEELPIVFDYCTRLFKKETVQRFMGYFKRIGSSIAKTPDIKLADIEIISPGEKEQILIDFNNTQRDYPAHRTIHHLFEEQVKRGPDRIAVNLSNAVVSYRQLNETSDLLAQRLKEKGAGPDIIVGLMMKRSIEMIIGILGILKAGGAYLPIELDYPRERIAYMMADSGTGILVTDETLAKEVKALRRPDIAMEIETIFVNAMKHLPGATSQSRSLSRSSHLAYVIYTSGSTGKPKGVLTTHYNATRVVLNTNYIQLKNDDRVLQWSNYAFDGSVFDIYGALLNGAVLVMLEGGEASDVQLLSDVIGRQLATVFFVTTALFNLLADEQPQIFKHIRKLLFGGERVSVDHARRALEYCGSGVVSHVYGPTETTVYATYYPVNNVAGSALTVPIGQPLANTTVYILDNHWIPIPIGVTGEIYIGGYGTARGYLNRPGLTAEKFVRIAHRSLPIAHSKNKDSDHDAAPESLSTHQSHSPHSTLYRTGDMGRWLAGGNIEFIGRTDQQVKIRGFRIEPGEIENCLLKQGNIKETVVLHRLDDKDGRYLCAYVVYSDPSEKSDLREYLSKSLPDYMVPSYFVE
ncbi:MAG: amino acid adenylation domain-containing protein, partial [bacterium]|nr:amino acid adenylation domain-containing protein [bacterium]